MTAGKGESPLPGDGNPSGGAALSAFAHQRPQPPTPASQGRGTAAVQAPPVLAPAPGNPVAVISTTAGDITIELFRDRSPVSVENFLQYAREGFYEGTIFHRVIPKFMVYINVADNPPLDHRGYSPAEFGYAVFGRVLSGMDVVDRIAAVPTKPAGGMDDVPVEPVVIQSVTPR